MSSCSLFFLYISNSFLFSSPIEPLPLRDRYPEQRCGEDPWCQRGWCMEGLFWGDSPGDRWWVRHALRSGVHLSGHDVCYWLKARHQSVIILGKKKGPLFWHVCLPFAVTLPACHLSTCAQGCLQWWAPYWLTSMPTTLTPPRRPTTSLPLTALLLQTSGWVTAESTSQNQCSAAGATVMFKKEENAEMYPCFSLFFCCCNFLF